MDEFKKERKVVTRSITVGDDIVQFFNWLAENNYNRSKVVINSLINHHVYKTYIMERKKCLKPGKK